MSGDNHSVGAWRQDLRCGRFQWIGWRQPVGFHYKVVWIGLPVVVGCDQSVRRVIHAQNWIAEHTGKPEATQRWPQRAKHYCLGLGSSDDKAADHNDVTDRNHPPSREVKRLRSYGRKLRIF